MASTSFDETALYGEALGSGREYDSVNQTRSAFDLRYITSVVRANVLLITAVVAAFVALGVIYTMLQTPRYTARATIQISDTVNRVLNTQDENQGAGAEGWDVDRYMKTQVDILKSRGLAERVVQKLGLANNQAFFASQESQIPAAGPSNDAARAAAAQLVQGNLDVVLPRDSRIVTVTWESADPRMSALIVNTYASEFIQANLQRKFDSSSYARQFVSEQLVETKRKVEESERALNDYSRQNGLIRTRDMGSSGSDKNGGGGSAGESVTTASLLQLNAALNDATSRRIAAEGRWQALAAKPLLGTTEVLANSTVASLLAARAGIESELQQERARHLEGYPAVQAKQAQLAVINRQLQQAAGNVRDSVRAELVAAQESEQKLAGQVNQLKSQTLSEQDQNVRYSMLAREADTDRQLYDSLLQRFKELNASSGIALSNISIIDTAQTPGGPTSPNLFKNVLMALLLGAGAAAMIVFLKEQFDDSIRVPEDVEAKLALPLLGVIPLSRNEEPEQALIDPKSPISEAYNSLRGSLLFSTPQGVPQVILLTSAQPSEGKTTSSYAVATSFARIGKSVLLIDADLRRPSLHRQIGRENSRGLSTLLTSHEPLSVAIEPSSAQENLSFLTSGPIPPSPTELLSSPRLEQIVQEASARFDIVIIDSPPVLGLADAPMMASLADGVVFVVEAERSRRGSLKSALRRLRAVQPILLGAVLTKFDPAKVGNRYSEYYGYEYYQYGSAQPR